MISPRHQAVSICLRLLFGWLVLALLGAWPTWKLGGSRALGTMLLAQGLVTVAVCGSVAMVAGKMSHSDPTVRLSAMLKSSVLRFIGTLASTGALLMIGWRHVDVIALIVWIGVTYCVMIFVESFAVVKQSKQIERRT